MGLNSGTPPRFIEKPDNLVDLVALISKDIDPELAEQLGKLEGHEYRVELLLLAILKQLKVG